MRTNTGADLMKELEMLAAVSQTSREAIDLARPHDVVQKIEPRLSMAIAEGRDLAQESVDRLLPIAGVLPFQATEIAGVLGVAGSARPIPPAPARPLDGQRPLD